MIHQEGHGFKSGFGTQEFNFGNYAYGANINYNNNIESITENCRFVISGYNYEGEANIYEIGILKKDNWKKICELADITETYSDEAELCSDSVAISKILENENAVKYMIKQCTGTFMNAFVKNIIAMQEYETSPYKSLIENNMHWAKFISMTQV